MGNDHRRLRARLTLFAALALACAATPALAQIPNPIVTGPIPQNAPLGDPSHDYTFFASEIVADFDYVEQEFFIEGTANQYETPPLATGTVVSSDHPYKTRIVVRRPQWKCRFNGTVILEWQNVTAGYDIEASWQGGNAEHFMREGYVWVGVSAQRVGVQGPTTGLKDWSPTRYESLDVTDGGTLLNDELSYDIFSQAGQALMNPLGVDPLDGLKPERILASGASQSASRLTVYYNSIQPLANLFDGFLLIVGGSTLRTDLGVPVFKLFSETEISLFGYFGPPQPDSDILRTWQVAGAAHADRTFLDNVQYYAGREGIPTTPPGVCTFPEGSEVRFYHVTNAAHDHMVRWVKDGTPPPTAPAIEIESMGPPTVIARDELGLALGGIRLADIAAPTALNTGQNGGPSFCVLFGTHVPFDEETLDDRYPTHGAYVKQVWNATMHNLLNRYVTLRDAVTTIWEATISDVGK